MILIDVRTKEEFDNDHISGAIHHDIMNMMEEKFPSVSHDEEIHLYCESGNRSMMAKSMMESVGFTNIIDEGGINNLK